MALDVRKSASANGEHTQTWRFIGAQTYIFTLLVNSSERCAPQSLRSTISACEPTLNTLKIYKYRLNGEVSFSSASQQHINACRSRTLTWFRSCQLVGVLFLHLCSVSQGIIGPNHFRHYSDPLKLTYLTFGQLPRITDLIRLGFENEILFLLVTRNIGHSADRLFVISILAAIDY
jgi:hypothetical protein